MEVRPLSPALGAEVTGIDLAGPVSDAELAELVDAFLRFKVLCLPGQDITRDQQRAIAARIAPVLGHGTFGAGNRNLHHSDADDVVRVLHDETTRRGLDNMWHSDSMFWPEPPMGAMLRAIEVPPCGGDTVWANMNAAYEGLSAAMQEFLLPLKAVNDVAISTAYYFPERAVEMRERFPPVEHPVVRTHPQTGLKGLYVSEPNTTHVVGLTPSESRELLQHLFRQASIPEYQCRVRWAPGTICLWDNRVTQHYAVYDYAPQTRIMERVAWIGDKPI